MENIILEVIEKVECFNRVNVSTCSITRTCFNEGFKISIKGKDYRRLELQQGDYTNETTVYLNTIERIIIESDAVYLYLKDGITVSFYLYEQKEATGESC